MNLEKCIKCPRGSAWRLIDAYYAGKEVVSNFSFYNLLLLFCRTMKGGESKILWRKISIKTSDPDCEFNQFFQALYGYPIKIEKGTILDFKELTSQIISDIQSNHYVFRIQWFKLKDYNVWKIGYIQKINLEILRRPDFLWPESAIKKYPKLKQNNEALLLKPFEYKLISQS